MQLVLGPDPNCYEPIDLQLDKQARKTKQILSKVIKILRVLFD